MYRSKQPNRNSSGDIQKSEKKICEKTKRKRGQVKTYEKKLKKRKMSEIHISVYHSVNLKTAFFIFIYFRHNSHQNVKDTLCHYYLDKGLF